MKKYLHFVLLLAFCDLSAQTLVSSSQMAPGIIYRKYTTTSPYNQEIHVLEVDLKDPTVKFQHAKAGDTINGGRLTVKQIAAANDVNEAYHNVIGAINGDFFVISGTSQGNPMNLFVNDGELMASKNDPIDLSIFGITEDNNPFISRRKQYYTVTRKGDATQAFYKINGTRTNDTLVFYNRYRGPSTKTDNTGTELKIGLVAGASWNANAQIQCTVLSKQVGVGNMSFSAGQAVLSGKGTKSTYLQGFNVGDTVTLQLDVANGVSGVNNISEVVGGFGRLVANGENHALDSLLSEGGNLAQDTTHQAHSAIGISQDERFLYMVVVDGKLNPNRWGMSLTELGNFLIYLGAYNGINIDGGGSSTLVANNVVKNIPQDAGVERAVGTSLLAYSATRLLDGFESNEGHFNRPPGYTSGTQYTTGISINGSSMDRVTTNACSGVGSERVILVDSASISTPWTVRLLSGTGIPSNNDSIASTGTLSFWLKTNTAQPGATVQVWFDDSDGAEASPALTILNDGEWHQYSFDLDNFNGTTITTGNGQLDASLVTLDAIVVKQANTSSSWTIYFDDVVHDKASSGTTVKSQNKILDDFEINTGHFDQKPTNTSGTQYTVGISTSSTLQRVTTEKHRGVGGLRAQLIDSAGSSANWTVRLMSGSGMPSNNFKFTSDGTLSFWMKTSTAQSGATVQIWFDDSDGAEVSPALSVNNDGQWHLYNFNLDNYNGTTITTGNGQLDASLVTLDAIVLKQNNTSSTWTVYFDDVEHLTTGPNPGTIVNKIFGPISQQRISRDQPLVKEIAVFPNPNKGTFTLQLPYGASERYQVELFDTNGKKVFSGKYSQGTQTVNCSTLPNGIYILSIESKTFRGASKIIIQK